MQEESYTSKASALDLDPLPIYDPKDEADYHFSGKRVQRGLYRAQDGTPLNADVNGSANILRKAIPNALVADGIEAVLAVRPLWMPVLTVQPWEGSRINQAIGDYCSGHCDVYCLLLPSCWLAP